MMNTVSYRRWMSTASLLVAVAFSAPAQAGVATTLYSSLFVFGDSLSDPGNNAAVLFSPPYSNPPFSLSPTLPTQITGNSFVAFSPYASGTYSNGPVWAQILAPRLGAGVTANAWLQGGTNFAFGGAETSFAAPIPGFSGATTFSLQSQLNAYLTQSSGVADGHAIYVLEGGANNVRRLLGTGEVFDSVTVALEAAKYAKDVGGLVDQLQAAGAKNIIVWNTPNVGLNPESLFFGSALSSAASAAAEQFNNALATRLAGEAGVKTFDVYSTSAAAASNPAAFGLTNVNTACGNNASGCGAKPLYWDGIHPTTAGHQLLADGVFALAVPVPEPSTYALFAVGLTGCGWAARRRRG